MAITSWVQHAFCDPALETTSPDTVTILDKVNFMNEGYQLCPSPPLQPPLVRAPLPPETDPRQMKESGSSFPRLDFMQLFSEPLNHPPPNARTREKKLVTWQP